MSTARIFHLDDSALSLKFLKDGLKNQPFEITQYKSGSDMLKILEDPSTQLPNLIISDYNMPNMHGGEALAWIKRNPKIHGLPVVFLTADRECAQTLISPKKGAFAAVVKPYRIEDIMLVIQKALKQPFDLKALAELDQAFATEAQEQVLELRAGAASLDEAGIQSAYRALHTIKGSALSLQFPTLGEFIHEVESLVNAVKEKKVYGNSELRAYLAQIVDFIALQIDHIQKLETLDLAPEPLTHKLNFWKEAIHSNMVAAAASGSSVAPSTHATINTDATSTSSPSYVLKSHNSVRISNEKLNEIQNHIKRTVQIRTKISSFANALKSEFPDESFPLDLEAMVQALSIASSHAMDFFILLRVIPAARLQSFCELTVNQAAQKLNKQVQIQFSRDTGLEIDQSIEECLQGAFTHILRNSLDHGIEMPDERTQMDKSPTGTIRIEMKNEGKMQFSVLIVDDGKGIDPKRLRDSMITKGIMSAEQADKLKEDQVLDMIFVDGLSTKDEANEFSGRGVGLGAVREQITKLGGSIRVTSLLGRGTTFQIILPRIFKL